MAMYLKYDEDGVGEFAFFKCRECLNCVKTRSVTYTRTAARPP